MTDYQKQKNILEITINRIDKYVESVNNKAAFIIAFNTFILGTAVFKYSSILDLFQNEKIKTIVYFAILLLFIGVGLSLVFCFLSVKPYLKSGNSSGDYRSLLFFGSISEMNIQVYSDKIKNLDDPNIIEDLCRQNHVLSAGLTYKFKKMQQSFFCVFFLQLLPMVSIAFLKCIDWIIK